MRERNRERGGEVITLLFLEGGGGRGGWGFWGFVGGRGWIGDYQCFIVCVF